MIICPNCGSQLEDGASFCNACGAQIEQQQTVTTPPQKSGSAKKFILLGVIAAAVVALVIILISAFSGSKNPDYALYIRDGELFYSKLSGKPTEITSDLWDGATNSDLLSKPYSSYFTVTQDGKRLFYVDKYKDGVTLYTKDLTKSKAEAEKIDSDIYEYVVSEDGKTLTYLKSDGDSYILYQHNLKEKTKVASKVDEFIVSMDGKKIIYINDEGDMYSYNGKDSDKISSSVTDVYMVDKKLSKICYQKEDVLYVKNGKKDAEKIASDVVKVKAYPTGEIYYFTSVEEEPVADGDTVDMVKQTLKQQLAENGMGEKNLYYYDGKKAEKISTAYSSISFPSDVPVAIYVTIDIDDIEIKDVSSLSDILEDSMKAYILCGKTLNEVSDPAEIQDLVVSEDGTVVYYISDIDDEGKYGDLYKMAISKGKLGKAERVDSDVSTYSLSIVTDKNLPLYYKELDSEGNSGELYINKQRIDFDVRLGYNSFIDENNTIAYYTDWNSEKQQGTLKVATLKGKSTKVADDVHSYTVTPNGDILYLYDYNITSLKGELHLFNGKKSTKLDDDVVRIISFKNDTYYMYREFDWIED